MYKLYDYVYFAMIYQILMEQCFYIITSDGNLHANFENWSAIVLRLLIDSE